MKYFMIRTFTLMASGYLPNSPYKAELLVEDFTFIKRFRNFLCNCSTRSLFKNPQTYQE